MSSAPGPVAIVPPKPRRWRRWVVLAALGLGLGVAGWQVRRMLIAPTRLVVVNVQSEDVARVLAVTGRIEASRTVTVSPQAVGRLTEIVRYEGDVVAAGDVLAKLEDATATSAVLQQRAALASRRSDLAQAERDQTRTQGLVAAGAISAEQLEQAKLVVSRIRADIKRLGADLQQGRSQLILAAPFDGTIIARSGELGQVVSPTTAVFELASLTDVRVAAQVDERYVRVLRRGMRALISPLDQTSPPVGATVSYVAQAIDPLTGAATVRFAYDTPPADVTAGLSVDVNIAVDERPAVLTVPRQAVGGAGAQAFVLVVHDGRVERRAIEVEDWPAARTVVRRGLVAGETIALDPLAAADGTRVNAEVQGAL